MTEQLQGHALGGAHKSATKGMNVSERLDFYSMPVPYSGCWIWMGWLKETGYGFISIGGYSVGAHRAQWERFNGPIPKGLFVCHKCDVRSCVNPDHLFLGTQKDNMQDAVNKGRVGGVNNWNAKIAEDEVMDIVKNKRLYRIIAKDYDVTKSAISSIKNGHSWNYLTKIKETHHA